MVLLDLFCGRWGWSKAFAKRGWDCIGVDWVEPPEIPEGCKFIHCDVRHFAASLGGRYRCWNPHTRTSNGSNVDFIVASSPCEQFSTMKNFRPPVPYPELGIALFNHARSMCEASGVPYIMENVAGAMRYVGKAVNHCGPYYLWGNAVPPILPQGINKGMTAIKKGLREHKGKPGWADHHNTAEVATIPPELANCVAEYAERLLEQREIA